MQYQIRFDKKSTVGVAGIGQIESLEIRFNDSACCLEVEYLGFDALQKIISKCQEQSKCTGLHNSPTENETKSSFSYARRTRFLSEDNCYPSFQVMNFQTLVLQNEYLSNDSKALEPSDKTQIRSLNNTKTFTNQINLKNQILHAIPINDVCKTHIKPRLKDSSLIAENLNGSLEICEEDYTDILFDMSELDSNIKIDNQELVDKIAKRAEDLKKTYELSNSRK